MKHIVFCLPGAPTLHNAMSWDDLRTAFAERSDELRMTIVRGYSSSVVHCRNQLLEAGVKGLKKHAKPFGGMDYDFMMWIDSDAVYTPGDFFRLLEFNQNIVTGLVPIDTEGRGAVGKFNNFNPTKYLDLRSIRLDDPVFHVDFCGFAFLLVKHGVFEALDYPWFQMSHFEVEGGRIVQPSEDFAWCMRVKEKGFEIFAHPGVRIGHEKRVIMETPGPSA